MDDKYKALLMTLAYQRMNELSIAINQIGQATAITKDENEKMFLSQQGNQMKYMQKELGEVIKAVEWATEQK